MLGYVQPPRHPKQKSPPSSKAVSSAAGAVASVKKVLATRKRKGCS
jgi:hypothetical protein